jgi:hypothetical protein
VSTGSRRGEGIFPRLGLLRAGQCYVGETLTSSTRQLSAAETASLVRKAVKTAHPGVEFRVRSKTYAGGASVDVSWTYGPTAAQIEATAKLYQGATFDGMTDCSTYRESLLSTDDGAGSRQLRRRLRVLPPQLLPRAEQPASRLHWRALRPMPRISRSCAVRARQR